MKPQRRARASYAPERPLKVAMLCRTGGDRTFGRLERVLLDILIDVKVEVSVMEFGHCQEMRGTVQPENTAERAYDIALVFQHAFPDQSDLLDWINEARRVVAHSVICFSSASSSQDIQDLLAAGVSEIVLSPPTQDSILSRIALLCEGRDEFI